ncbi:hypothetical protein TELCIR_13793 [Teladorsagia circumcincta]|uniref:Uncharacterized protein n=1 Tax=Teladorsagia circumcincta TaxID=45464 RepID=A0A2G9U311_TELCI|nr:hypothetical protein TELCIR_13793 [Teladorsagia circumcincta]
MPSAEELSAIVQRRNESQPSSPAAREESMALGEWIQEQATQQLQRSPVKDKTSPLKSTQRSTKRQVAPHPPSFSTTSEALTPTQQPDKLASTPLNRMSGEADE